MPVELTPTKNNPSKRGLARQGLGNKRRHQWSCPDSSRGRQTVWPFSDITMGFHYEWIHNNGLSRLPAFSATCRSLDRDRQAPGPSDATRMGGDGRPGGRVVTILVRYLRKSVVGLGKGTHG